MIAVQPSCSTISACNSRQVRRQGDGVQLPAGRRTRHLHAVWPPQPRWLFLGRSKKSFAGHGRVIACVWDCLSRSVWRDAQACRLQAIRLRSRFDRSQL